MQTKIGLWLRMVDWGAIARREEKGTQHISGDADDP